jgi:hypothetical protein
LGSGLKFIIWIPAIMKESKLKLSSLPGGSENQKQIRTNFSYISIISLIQIIRYSFTPGGPELAKVTLKKAGVKSVQF